MKTRHAVAALVIGVALVLSSCSKSGGGDSGAAAPSNNWDSMIWDQGKWQ